jgi:hypothetical protein
MWRRSINIYTDFLSVADLNIIPRAAGVTNYSGSGPRLTKQEWKNVFNIGITLQKSYALILKAFVCYAIMKRNVGTSLKFFFLIGTGFFSPLSKWFRSSCRLLSCGYRLILGVGKATRA